MLLRIPRRLENETEENLGGVTCYNSDLFFSGEVGGSKYLTGVKYITINMFEHIMVILFFSSLIYAFHIVIISGFLRYQFSREVSCHIFLEISSSEKWSEMQISFERLNDAAYVGNRALENSDNF